VAEHYHFSPDVWLAQDSRIRQGMLKDARLKDDAMRARKKQKDRQAKK
jgi:hypothetical protein